MPNASRVWLEYRPVRIGWVIADRDLANLTTGACLWGGSFNPIIPLYDLELAEQLVKSFAVDLLIPVRPTDATQAFVNRFVYLARGRWREPIFEQRQCEFADIRHVVRRIHRRQDNRAKSASTLPTWDQGDWLDPLFSILFGRYPEPSDQVADYRGGILRAYDAPQLRQGSTRAFSSLLDEFLAGSMRSLTHQTSQLAEAVRRQRREEMRRARRRSREARLRPDPLFPERPWTGHARCGARKPEVLLPSFCSRPAGCAGPYAPFA
jgi:hypothetical protein